MLIFDVFSINIHDYIKGGKCDLHQMTLIYHGVRYTVLLPRFYTVHVLFAMESRPTKRKLDVKTIEQECEELLEVERAAKPKSQIAKDFNIPASTP